MSKAQDLSASVIFPKGAEVHNDHFTGDVWLGDMVTEADGLTFTAGNVTFAPGARNNWHKHPGGQTLLVTGGEGYYQEAGKAARVIREGDVVKIAPGMKHWHGAGHDSWLVHVYISARTEQGVVEWLEPVTDKEYRSL